MTIIGALMVSVVSYAQTSPASASNTVTTIGITGGTGRPITQDALGSSNLISVALSGSTEVSVADSTGFAVGDYVRVDDGTTVDFHTVAGVSAGTVTITPALATSFPAGGTTSVVEQAVYTTVPTWNPVIGSTTSIKPGNHFLVNATGLSTSNASVVDILLTNGDQLTHNYGHLNRRMNVYVLCDTDVPCTGGPFVETTAPGEWGQSKDAAGTDISEVPDFLNLTNARQGFVLGGGYVYGITVDGGTVFTVDTNEGVNDSLSPTDLAQSSIF
ncbi:MAG: hypothetical protein HOE75_13090 [Chloroflexi bacterium]|nr:hypothetical protein [Chloroflexota bacterium]